VDVLRYACCPPFCLVGRVVVQGRMKALAMVKAFHIHERVALGLVAGGVGPVVDQLGLQRVKEALHGRVVQRVGAPAHGRGDAAAGQCRLLVAAGILNAPVRVVYQASTWPLPPGGHQ